MYEYTDKQRVKWWCMDSDMIYTKDQAIANMLEVVEHRIETLMEKVPIVCETRNGGVFATQNIREGKVIGYYYGELKLFDKKCRSCYTMEAHLHVWLDPFKDPNHSLDIEMQYDGELNLPLNGRDMHLINHGCPGYVFGWLLFLLLLLHCTNILILAQVRQCSVRPFSYQIYSERRGFRIGRDSDQDHATREKGRRIANELWTWHAFQYAISVDR